MGSSASRRKQEELSAAIENGWSKGVQDILAHVSAAKSSEARPDDKEQQVYREVDLNAPLPTGYTPLQLAALKGCTDVVRLLLEFDPEYLEVDPNAVGSAKKTALHLAAAGRKVRCVAELLAHGADPCIAAADDGKTPLDIARLTGCPRCVQAIEGSVVLWQGWVDHYEQRMLLIPSWKAKWLVLSRDRRPNTGPPGKRLVSSRPCSRCGAVQPLPKLVSRFPCERCGYEIRVPASLQLALYELAPGASEDEDIDVSISSASTQALPQDPSLIGLSEVVTAFQNTVSSKRQNAATVRVLDSWQRLQAEFAFRFESKTERSRVFTYLSDPQRAALEAEAASEQMGNWCQGDEDDGGMGSMPEPSAPPQSCIYSEVGYPATSLMSTSGLPPSPTGGSSPPPERGLGCGTGGVFVRCSVFPCGVPTKAGPEVQVTPPRASQATALVPLEEDEDVLRSREDALNSLGDSYRLDRSSEHSSPLPIPGNEASCDQALQVGKAGMAPHRTLTPERIAGPPATLLQGAPQAASLHSTPRKPERSLLDESAHRLGTAPPPPMSTMMPAEFAAVEGDVAGDVPLAEAFVPPSSARGPNSARRAQAREAEGLAHTPPRGATPPRGQTPPPGPLEGGGALHSPPPPEPPRPGSERQQEALPQKPPQQPLQRKPSARAAPAPPPAAPSPWN